MPTRSNLARSQTARLLLPLVAFGLLLMPVVSTVSVLLMSLFLYYYFQFFENRTENFRKIFTFVILTSIPFYIFQIISEYFAPITLIGFGFSFLLSIIYSKSDLIVFIG